MAAKNLDAEIAIIGAGSAGLTAAKELQAQGRSFVLLEASHRIGGRAYTETLAENIPFDLGAHWIHSDELNPFVKIARDCGAALERDEDEYILAEYFEDGHWLPKSADEEFGQYFEQQFAALELAAKEDDSRSVYDVIDNDSRWAPYFYLFFGQDYTCDVDMVSARDAASYIEKGIDFAVKSGFGDLLTKYGAGVPVSLNTAVSEIDCSGPNVRVTTSKGELRVAKVILTVSTGVLATQQIKFLPALPDWKIDAINSLPLGSCTRVGLTFKEAFLHDLPDDFTIKTGDDEPLHFRNRPCGLDCVEITTGGRIAEWMEKSGEQATIDYILSRLKQVLGNNASVTVDRKIVSAWDGDAWTKGSYSYALPGARHQRARLAEPIDEKLFFAGEATSSDYFSTVHGAYFSAVAAVSVL